jgi:FtsH-binding integral membrane protein
VQTMQASWTPDGRMVPSPWGQIALHWFWLLVAAIALSLIPWRSRRTDARGLVALSIIALLMFTLGVTGLKSYKDFSSYVGFDIAADRWIFLVAMLIVFTASSALMIWLATARRPGRNDSQILRLVMALNLSLLLLYGAFVILASSSDSAEKDSIIKGLLVLAALTWEITASGSVTNVSTRHMPRASRLLLFLAYILLVAVTVFMFFPSRYRGHPLQSFKPDEDILLGVLLLGIPLIFAAFATRVTGLLRTQSATVTHNLAPSAS